MPTSQHPFRELITMLVLTLVALTLYALADQPLSLFGMEVKQAAITHFFSSSQSSVAAAKDSIPVISVTNEDSVLDGTGIREAVPDTSRQSILLTGDSMAEGLMFAFKKYAQHNGHSLKTIIWYGSTTTNWAKTDTLKKLIQRYRPTYVLLALGSNELFVHNIALREPYIQDIVQQAGRTRFIWIGPPNWKEDTGIHELLVKNVGASRFFVSKHLSLERASDGRHPSRQASAIWADTISSWVMQASQYPIMLKKPEDQLSDNR